MEQQIQGEPATFLAVSPLATLASPGLREIPHAARGRVRPTAHRFFQIPEDASCIAM